MHCLFARILYNNAHQTAFAVVYDLLHGVLKLYLTFLADHGKLAFDSILNKLFNGFSKNIGLPDAFPSCVAFPNVCDQVFCLLLCSHNWRNLIIWMEGLLDLIFTPYLFPWRITAGSSSWIWESSGTTTP